MGIITPETLVVPAAPTIDILGLAVRVQAPEGASPVATLFRRDVRTGGDPVVLVDQWDVGEPYVDTTVLSNTIYAYSLANSAALLTDQDGTPPLNVGPRGPEAYAPIVPPEQIIAP